MSLAGKTRHPDRTEEETRDLIRRLARTLARRSVNSAGWWNDEGVRPLIHETRDFLGEPNLCGD